MQINRLFKHENNTDVCAEFLKIIPTKNYYVVKLTWWNCVNPENLTWLGVTETHKISRDNIEKWRVYANNNIEI